MTAEEWLNKWDDTLHQCRENTHYNATEELIKLIEQIKTESFNEGIKFERKNLGLPTLTLITTRMNKKV